jgi:hypothetical protein
LIFYINIQCIVIIVKTLPYHRKILLICWLSSDNEDMMGRTCSTNGEKRNAYKILVGSPEGRRPLGRPRLRWVNNIKMNLGDIGWDGRDWIDLAQDGDQWKALVNAVMKFRVP